MAWPGIALALFAIAVGLAIDHEREPETQQIAWAGPLPSIDTTPAVFAGARGVNSFISWAREPERPTEAILRRMVLEDPRTCRTLVGVAVTALQSGTPREQVMALAAMERCLPDDPEVVRMAIEFTYQSQRPDVRAIAVAILAHRPTQANLETLLQIVSEAEHRGTDEIQYAVLALGRARFEPALDTLVQLTSCEREPIAVSAAIALDTCGTAVGRALVVGFARTASRVGRIHALKHLRAHRPGDAAIVATEWLDDPTADDLLVSWANRTLFLGELDEWPIQQSP